MSLAIRSIATRLYQRLTQKSASRPHAPRHRARLSLEQFEAREVPAAFTWMGYDAPTNTFSTNAQAVSNWWMAEIADPDLPGPSVAGPATRLPGNGDDVTIPGVGVVIPGGSPYYPDCYGLTVSGGGAFQSLTILSNYTGTVTFGAAITTGTFSLGGGAISQPGTDLTVTGNFSWTGGALNSSPNLANVNVLGNGSIAPAGAGTVSLGSNLIFTGTQPAPKTTTQDPGTVLVTNAASSIIVGAFANVTARTYTAGDVIGINKNIAGAQKIQILANGTLGVVGPGTINYDLWLSNAGVFNLTGSAKVNLTGVVNPPPQNPTNYGQLAGSQLNIENGSVLTATNAFGITGGTITLKMNSNLPANQQTATMTGLVLLTGATIKFSPPINIGTTLVYGTFLINGDVYWSDSTYMPNVDYTTAGLANKWVVNGKMSVDPNLVNNLNTCIIQPVNLNGNNPPANSSWVVLDATTTNNIAPTIKKDGAGNLLTFAPAAVGARTQWKLSS